MVVIICLLAFPGLASLLVLRRFRAVFGAKTKRAVQITDFSEPTMSRPGNAFAPKVWEGHTISLDSSANPNMKVVLGASLTILFLFNLVALAINTWSTYSPVSAKTIAALAGVARPDSAITAGVVGMSGLHTLRGGGGDSYDCSLLIASSDVRTCGTLGAAGGFTLFFSLLALLLVTAISTWTALVAWWTWKRSSDVTLGAKKPKMLFHPHFFTLAALHSVSLLASALMWALGGHVSLATSLYVPSASWSLGASWWLHLVSWLVSVPLVWFYRNVVEYAYAPTTGQDAAGQELANLRRRFHSAIGSADGTGSAAGTGADGGGAQAAEGGLNNTQGSDEGGLDLPEEDQAEAYIVRNQLTV